MNWSIGEAAFLAELEDRQLLVGEVLRTSGDTEVGDGFQGGVQEKVKWGLFRTVKPELCTDSLCECGCVRSGLTAVVRWELGNWSFGFSVPGFPSRPESASAKPRSEVACFQYVAASA